MTKLGVSTARENLAEVVDRTRYTKERVILTKRGKEVGALIPMEDLRLLELLEDQLDIEAARKALKDAGDERISYDDLRKERAL